MIYWTILISLFVAACSYFDTVDEHTGSDLSEVDQLQLFAAQLTDEIIVERDQATGWPSADDCDGTLWAGLACAAGVPNVGIEQTFLAPGVIGRRPGHDCHAEDRNENGEPDSASTTSVDMATGFLACAIVTQRMDLLELFATAGESRKVEILGEPGFVIGEPYPEMAPRVLLRRNSIGLLGRAIYKLSGGDDRRDYRALTPVYFGVSGDSDRHIQTIDISMQGEVGVEQASAGLTTLDITQNALDRLKANVEADEFDWTARAVLAVYTGDFQQAIRRILDPAAPCPSYTRGSPINCKVSRLWAARTILKRYPREQ